MGGVFKNMASLVNALQAEMREAMEEVTEKSLKDADNEMQVFDDGGTPDRYDRVYNYENSPDTHGVSGSGNVVDSDIYLNDGYDYNTGTFSTPEVFKAAESGSYGIVGTPGTWARIEEDIQQNIDNSFGKRFN